MKFTPSCEKRQKRFGIDRLFEKVEGPCLHGLHRHADFAVSRQKDDRQITLHLRESCLKFGTGQPRHAHVEKHAAFAGRIITVKKLSCGFIGPHLIAHGLKHKSEGCSHARIVVNDANQRHLLHVSIPDC